MNLANWYVNHGYTMNRELRTGRPVSDRNAKKLITTICKCAPLTSELRLYRGLDWEQNILAIDPAVMSASGDESVALGFVRCRIEGDRAVPDGTMLILDIQPGVRVLRIGGPQNEYLIEPGTTLTEVNRTTVIRRGGQITYVWYVVTK